MSRTQYKITRHTRKQSVIENQEKKHAIDTDAQGSQIMKLSDITLKYL